MRYLRLMPLGSGGMANVHLALAVGQSGFKRLVVIKSMREELSTDGSNRQLFLAEARLSARLNHPNVVQVSEVLETPDGVMLVMEYLDGLSLSAAYRSAGDALTLPMRLRILCEVLSGLQYAHDLTDYHGQPLGIVHRDVSPQNVFLTFDGRVKLLDFGIAKVNAAPDRTRTGVIKGRIAYMPIEQFSATTVDRRTDVYAVGCLLWEAVARTRMWANHTESQILRDVLNGNIPRLSDHVEVDPELERIVQKATGAAPEDRHASADELRLELEAYLATLPPVSLREIGEILAASCAEARAERQRQLTEAIAYAERDPDGAEARFSSEQVLTSLSPGSGSTSLPGTPSTEENRAIPSVSAVAERPPRGRKRFVVLALAVLAIAIIAWAPTLERFFFEKPAAPTNAAQERRDPAPAPQPEAETPPPTEPAAIVPAVSEEPATLEAAPEDTAKEPSAARSSAKEKTTRPRVAPVKAGAQREPAPEPPAAPPPRAKTDCDPPYYFSAGIKTYKPECL
jgi:serine/threonine protein kinase